MGLGGTTGTLGAQRRVPGPDRGGRGRRGDIRKVGPKAVSPKAGVRS